MATSKKIIVLCKPDGTVSLETQGFSGGECRQATKAYETALGTKLSDVATAEMHQPEVPPVKRELHNTL